MLQNECIDAAQAAPVARTKKRGMVRNRERATEKRESGYVVLDIPEKYYCYG